jgi:hypothetical protein
MYQEGHLFYKFSPDLDMSGSLAPKRKLVNHLGVLEMFLEFRPETNT